MDCVCTYSLQAAFAQAPHVLRGLRYSIPSQHHFYMEPQVAVASPDEGGAVQVIAHACPQQREHLDSSAIAENATAAALFVTHGIAVLAAAKCMLAPCLQLVAIKCLACALLTLAHV